MWMLSLLYWRVQNKIICWYIFEFEFIIIYIYNRKIYYILNNIINNIYIYDINKNFFSFQIFYYTIIFSFLFVFYLKKCYNH